METLIQQQTRLDSYKRQSEQGKTAPFEGVVVSVTGISDQMGVSFSPTLARQMPIQHPFSGSSSWIRSVPETGTKFLMQNRFDSNQPEALKTLPLASLQRSNDYQAQLNVYRQLDPGEHDIASVGLATAYFSKLGHLDLRSGSHVKAQLSRANNHSENTAPTHIRRLLQHTVGTMGEEERVGIVKRWTSAVDETYPQQNGFFQNEHYLQLLNPANSSPAILLRRIEGQVYEDDGSVIKHFTTAAPLRSQELWYTTTDTIIRREIDQNGNMLIQLPDDATIGYELVIPKGNYRAQIGVDRNVTIDGNETVQIAKNIQYTVLGNVSYDVTKNFNIVAGSNALTMDVTAGQETVGLVNAQLLGFQAENTSDGGLTSIFGPKSSGMFFNGAGKVQIQDGLQGGATFEGETITLFSSGGATLSIGDTTVIAGASGSDMISIEDGLVQLISGDKVNVVGTTFGATVGTLFLGSNAAIPAVLGLQLMAWVDTHTHIAIGLGAPTSPPVIPSASLIGTPASPYSLTAFFSPNI